MAILRSKTMATAFALFLLFAMAVSLVAFPISNAQGTKKTYAYIGATPNPIGINQEVLIHVGITDALPSQEMGWEGLTVTITRPDGTTETISGIRTDATGGTGRVYVPTMAGNYTLQTNFPEQAMPAPGSRWVPTGTVMQASTSEKVELVVQEEPREYWPGVPLPTEYWARAIDAQYREWNVIAGSWLTTPHSQFAPYNDGPETGHFLWAKPLEIGGLVGAEVGDHSFDHGDAYEGRFQTGVKGSVIIAGILCYNRFAPTGGSNVEQEVVAVDLHTGEELWIKPLLDPDGVSQRLAFGQLFYWDSFNLHGAYAYLWTTVGSTWHAYDPYTGRWVYTIENVPSAEDIGRQSPSGHIVFGPNGEMYRYTVDTARGWMTLWNSSRTSGVVGTYAGSWRPHGNTYDGALGIEWNKTIPTGLPGVVREILDDRIIGMNIRRLGELVGATLGDPLRFWGISLKPGQEGQLLFNTTWQPPTGNLTLDFVGSSLEDGVFILSAKETRAHYGFSLDSGQLLWGPTESQRYLDLFNILNPPDYAYFAIADGKFFSAGFGGTVYAYDIKTGKRLWTFDVRDKYTEILWSDNWPLEIAFVTDGKIYLFHTEHSPVDPLARGAAMVCLDIENGEEIFSVNYRGTEWGGQPIIGDSIIAMFNTYDNRIYALGKGPSATIVTASPKVSVHGSSVLVEGIVTDVSPGTNDAGLAMRFPNGVPAVADESMSEWMEYVYMQKSRPANVTGVEVVLEVLDPNNNYYEVGRTTSDENGMFKLMFTPEVPGEYTVVASFAGSKAYYGSSAETAIGVEEAPAATPPPTPTPALMTDAYVLGIGSAILIAVIIGFIVLILIFRKR